MGKKGARGGRARARASYRLEKTVSRSKSGPDQMRCATLNLNHRAQNGWKLPMSLHAGKPMSVGTDWSLIKGWDSDGPTIVQDLLALKAGSLRGDALSEFLCDLIRESTPSPAAYPAIPYLMEAVDFLPWHESFEEMYTVAFVITRSSFTGSPPVPPELGEYFSNDFKMRLQAQ